MVFLPLIFKLTLGCFSLSSRLYSYQIASVSRCVCVLYFFFFPFITSIFLCVCMFDPDVYLYSNVNSVSSLDEPFRLLEQMLQ